MSHVDPSRSSSTSPPKLSLLGRSALKYAEHYGYAVHPLRPGDKRPLSAHGFKDASTDRDQITAWWTQHPEANIGIATGAVSGVSVLDVDVKDEAGGDVTLAALLAEHGETLDAHVHQRTWSGGLQYFFAYDPRARQGAACYGKGLDGRNDGGYVVAPPSVVNGAAYAWVVKPTTVWFRPMPEWLLEAAVLVKPASKGEGERKNPPGWADELMLRGVPKGERDQEAHRLIQHARETGKSEAECLARLKLFGSHCTPPFDPEQDRHIAAKIRKAYAREPVFDPPVPKPILGRTSSASPAVGEKAGPTLETVAQAQQRLGTHTEWLVDRMLAVGDLSVLVAKPGVGKSTFAANLAVSVAYGRPFLGRATRQGVVVLFAFEGARSTMSQMVAFGHNPSDPRILVWRADAETQNPAAWLETVLQGVTPALIVVDTLSDLVRVRHGASNAGYEEMVTKLGSIYAWAQAQRVHGHFLHHGGKGDREGIDSALGTIGIVSKPGTILEYRLLNPKDESSPRLLKGVKHREGSKDEDLPGLVLDYDPRTGLSVAGYREEVTVRELGARIVKIVAQTPGIKQTEILAEVEGRKSSKLEALRLLTDEGHGVLAREGTPGSRTFPVRLSVRPGLEGDPVVVWRRSFLERERKAVAVVFPEVVPSGSELVPSGSHGREPLKSASGKTENVLVPTILSRTGTYTMNKGTEERVGSREHTGPASESSGEPPAASVDDALPLHGADYWKARQ